MNDPNRVTLSIQKESRTQTVNLRLTDMEYKRLKRIASKYDLPLATVARQLLLQAVDLLEKQEDIQDES